MAAGNVCNWTVVGRVDCLTVYLYLQLQRWPTLLNDDDLNIRHRQLQMTQLFDGHERICYGKLQMTS